MTKRKPKRLHKPSGRPTVISKQALDLLREAFLTGATKTEACLFANIGRTALYEYMDRNPEFKNKIEEWQKNPFMQAKRTMLQGLKTDHVFSLSYMKARSKHFAEKIDNTIKVSNTIDEDQAIKILSSIVENKSDKKTE